jgi:DUF2934 family protein
MTLLMTLDLRGFLFRMAGREVVVMAKKKSAAPDSPAWGATTAPAAPRRRSSSGAAAKRARPGNGDTRADPSHEEIAEAAYHRYLSRRSRPGSDFDDWVEAERELRSRKSR